MSERNTSDHRAYRRPGGARIGSAAVLAILVVLDACGGRTSVRQPDTWTGGEGYRWRALLVHGRSEGGFTGLETKKTGIEFANLLPDTLFLVNRHTVNGSGVAVGDVNGDGLPDVFVAGIGGRSALYRNQGGFEFVNRTEDLERALKDVPATGAAFVDVDGDGDLDLLVTSLGGPHLLLLNDGIGRFHAAPKGGGLEDGIGGTTMAFADTDGDGDLDLYTTTYKVFTAKDLFSPRERSFERVVERIRSDFRIRSEFAEHYRLARRGNRIMRFEIAEPDRYYENDGTGHFVGVPLTGGRFLLPDGSPLAEPPLEWGLTAQFRDFNDDGAPDLYVCNDFESPDELWLGDGRGNFKLSGSRILRHTSQSSMAVDGADINRDGRTDLFVSEMLSPTHRRRMRQAGNPPPIIPAVGEIDVQPQVMQNTLFMGRPDGSYAETSWMYGVAASGWSWAVSFLDVDLDTWDDLLITTGHRYDAMDMDAQNASLNVRLDSAWNSELLKFPTLDLPNVAFRNIEGLRFEPVRGGWGLGESADVTHALAFGDFDGDGDLDAVTNRLNGKAGMFRNDAGAPRVAVRLRGSGGNSFGIGSRIRLIAGADTLRREMIAGGQYLSSSEPLVVFAAPDSNLSIEVDWRSGRQTIIDGVRPNRLYEIIEPDIQYDSKAPATQPAAPIPDPNAPDTEFEAELLAPHTEPFFDDRRAQPLLLRRLSQEGPGVAVADLDGDGIDDIVVGTGRGGRPAVYLGRRFGPLRTVSMENLPEATGDWTGMTVIQDEDGVMLAAAESGFEFRQSSRILLLRWRDGGLVETGSLDLGQHLPGPLAAADVDADGDLDLFVGTRAVLGRWPLSAPGLLFLREGEGFARSNASERDFAEAGMVTGASFADVDADGDLDLAVSRDWGSIGLYKNDGNGRFTAADSGTGIGSDQGWWRGLAWGDFDADGQPDLAAANWGWNSEYGRIGAPDEGDRMLRLYFGETTEDGGVLAVEAHRDDQNGRWVPFLKQPDLGRGIPDVRVRYPTMESYAEARVFDLLGASASGIQISVVNNLSQQIFLNRGSHFEARTLPRAAQETAAFSPVIIDADLDGADDLVLSQNFWARAPDGMVPLDAGRGLLLRGDTDARLSPVAGYVSGINVYGEQRGAASGDVDGDGRIDLVIAQNGAEAVLLRGRGPRGRIVVIRGSAQNPRAVGASVRAVDGDGIRGPVRILSAGSGYWSHSSTRWIVPLGTVAVEITTRHGRVEHELPPGDFAVTVGAIQ